MAARAVSRFVRIAPRKVRIVAAMIRGKPVGEALTLLKFTPRHGAAVLSEVLESAVANAKQRGDTDVDVLVVKRAHVDGGPAAHRFLPRAMGRATRVNKRTSHIFVELEEA